MPMLLEVMMVIVVMLLAVILVFLLIFLVALAMLPVEKSLSRVIWDMTAPKRKPRPIEQEGGFKAFSQQQDQSQTHRRKL